MSKLLVVRQFGIDGDIDNIYIVEAMSQEDAISSIPVEEGQGWFSLAINIDEVSLPYKVYRK
jgi:hypothetical protein